MTIDLSALGYREDAQRGLWVPDGARPDFRYNDGDHVETWIGDTVRAATDVGTFSRELAAGIRDWPSRYHLSSQRANLLRPLLDDLDGPVLEVGAGMGAVTRVLGEHGHDVVAIEGSPRRAATCVERCRDLPGVRVVADTVQGLVAPGAFGTVVVIGVLEYSRLFFPAAGRDPVDAMLEHLASLLAPGGQLVLAIENQLGLKYLAGFPEDHVGRRMFGVEDRYDAGTVVTFGRGELRRRLSDAGLDEQAWYYPFPDYKLPTSVVTEAALLPGADFDPLPLVVPSGRADHQRPEVTTFDLERAWRAVHRNGLLPDLANSFLVRASTRPLPASRTVAWYYGSTDRRPEFAKATAFRATGTGLEVRRERVLPQLPDTVAGTRMLLVDEPYVRARPWTDVLADVVGRDGWTVDDVAGWFGTWWDAFGATTGDPTPAGTVDGGLVDALPRNLLVDADGSAQFIDLEWCAQGPVPSSYVVFRALYDSLASLLAVRSPAGGTPLQLRDLITAVASRYGVELDDRTLVEHWERERAFQSVVLGLTVEASDAIALDAPLRVVRDVAAVVADADALREELRLERATHDAVRRTVSWRITGPLRVVRALPERLRVLRRLPVLRRARR
ncbi:methyltransferase [uncultured Cellulomonas sp.]|uniref:methyltransferase n=1 Tax=uncultured Cellulomonas sp. TaxID=189682 RepID=UPI00263538DB|nr:class I SAM-dependent methyltransferase [uncultured Cellulomonas sp.]